MGRSRRRCDPLPSPPSPLRKRAEAPWPPLSPLKPPAPIFLPSRAAQCDSTRSGWAFFFSFPSCRVANAFLDIVQNLLFLRPGIALRTPLFQSPPFFFFHEEKAHFLWKTICGEQVLSLRLAIAAFSPVFLSPPGKGSSDCFFSRLLLYPASAQVPHGHRG